MGIQISKSVKWFFISLSFFLWAGCSTEKEEGTAAESVGRVERVRLSFEGKSSDSEGSKVSFSESNGSFSWQGGESIRVQLSGGTAADGTVDAAGSSSTMTVTVPSGQSRTGFAYYPASIVSTTASSRNLTVTLPDTYDSYAYPYAPTPMIAEQTTESGVSVLDNLRFLHLGGVALLEVNVASDVTANVTSIKVSVDKRITGDFTATGSFGGYSIKTDGVTTSGTTVTYNLASGVAPGGTQKLFLPLPVGTYTINSVRAYGSDGINCIAKSSSATSSFNITRKGGSKFTDSKAIALAKTLEREYNVYEIVYGRGNCIVDSGTASNRSVSFDATPYEAGTNYLYTSTVATPDAAKTPVSAKVLWYESLSAAPSASLNTGTYQVTVSGISGTGNCVVGLYNSSNEIIWSFHIWSPGWNPTTTNTRAYTGTDSKSYTVMGAALGATASSANKETTWSYTHCGMYYQWGRKDPLGRVNSSKALSGTAVQSGIVPSTASAGIIAVDNADIGNATSVADHIAYSIKNPHMFITNGSGSYAWFSTDSDSYAKTNANWDNHLWGTLNTGTKDAPVYVEIGKTIFDPCPAGWKVVTTGIVFGKTTGSSAGSGTDYVGFQHTSPNDYFVYSGYRLHSSGALYNVAGYGNYWSSCQYSLYSLYGQSLSTFGTSGFSPTDLNRRALGLTVRCVRLQN